MSKFVYLNIILLTYLLDITTAVAITTSHDEFLREYRLNSKTCCQEVGATATDLQRLFDRLPATSLTEMCLRACLMKKYNVMDSSGKFVPSVALEESRRLANGDIQKVNIAFTMIQACSDIMVSDNPCKAAAEYDSCFKNQAKSMGLDQH